jgi:D-alanine-D-alanine ligase
MGGWSSEREVSLVSGRNVAAGLRNAGYETVPLDLTSRDRDEKRLAARLRRARMDAAFIVLHGGYGEDGGIQTLLDRLGIPFTGSPSPARAPAMHKGCSKLVFEANDIRTAPWKAWSRREFKPSSLPKELDLALPVVVKPADSGSAVGVTIVKKTSELVGAFRKAFKESAWVLAEKFVPGTEITVGVLGREALPVVEICPKAEFYDYDSKYKPGGSQHLVPARISASAKALAQRMALKAGDALGCEGYWRADFIVPKSGVPVLLEVNTVPGFTSVSLFPEAAKAAGYTYPKLLKALVCMAFKKTRRGRKAA